MGNAESENLAGLSAEDLAQAFEVFNEATAGLQVSHEALTCRVAELQTELADKNRQLARKDRLAVLGEMAAGVAHEIRNPLGSIQLYAGLLKREVAGRESQESLVDKLLAGSRTLNKIVEQLLAYTRHLPIEPVNCLLSRLVREALIYVAGEINGRSIEIVTTIPEDGLEVFCDPHQMGQVLLNLLLNSIQAVGDAGRIEIGGLRTDSGVDIRVVDDGCGISPEDTPRIFDPFFSSRTRGTGLGLALVHRILEEHGASISVDSVPEQGAKMTVHLPGAAS